MKSFSICRVLARDGFVRNTPVSSRVRYGSHGSVAPTGVRAALGAHKRLELFLTFSTQQPFVMPAGRGVHQGLRNDTTRAE